MVYTIVYINNLGKRIERAFTERLDVVLWQLDRKGCRVIAVQH